MAVKASCARAILAALTSVFLISGCAIRGSGPPQPDPTRTNEDIPEGPGLLTGERGALVFERGIGKDAEQHDNRPDSPQNQARMQRLDQQTKEFDQQIQELERQRRELEALKDELKEILESQPRAK